jgi:cobyrinic acid a,c-diamide synthase
VADALHRAGRLVAGYVDTDGLWRIMEQAAPIPAGDPPLGLFPEQESHSGRKVRIGVVHDAAFGFYYPENLAALVNHGAELVFCSALADDSLPRVDALYIGGGFPETHAAALSANLDFLGSLKTAAESGLPIYAECGGLMYLGRHIIVQGQPFPMAGVFPLDFAMQNKPQGHGYSVCRVAKENPFLPLGLEFRAHEFHYSKPQPATGAEFRFAYQVLRGKGVLGQGGGLLHKNVLGTYHHVHALGLTQWASGFTAAARRV